MSVWESFINNSFLVKLAAAIVELLVGFVLGPLVKKLILKMHARGIDEGVLTFTGSICNYGIRILAVVVALAQIGVDTSVLVGALSALGLGVSLALKENMANVAGGLQILITKPFKIGDYISCGDDEGTVESIDIMFTTLKTYDNQLVVMPNSGLVSGNITNFSYYPLRRIAVKVPVSSMGDYTDFCKKILSVISTNAKIAKDPAPTTAVSGFMENGNGMYITVYCHTTVEEYWDQLFWVNEKIQDVRKACDLMPPVSYYEEVSA